MLRVLTRPPRPARSVRVTNPPLLYQRVPAVTDPAISRSASEDRPSETSERSLPLRLRVSLPSIDCQLESVDQGWRPADRSGAVTRR